mgnify:CR=1 FL=1
MKKIIFAAALVVSAFCLNVTAENSSQPNKKYTNEFIESSISYRNVSIRKVLDHKDAYVVFYQKGHRDTGVVTVPKAWYKESPRKLEFRPLPKGMEPYMTILSKDGSFQRVMLTMPVDHVTPYWGVADSNVTINDADKDTLEVAY